MDGYIYLNASSSLVYNIRARKALFWNLDPLNMTVSTYSTVPSCTCTVRYFQVTLFICVSLLGYLSISSLLLLLLLSLLLLLPEHHPVTLSLSTGLLTLSISTLFLFLLTIEIVQISLIHKNGCPRGRRIRLLVQDCLDW